jgi:hypothetical protein
VTSCVLSCVEFRGSNTQGKDQFEDASRQGSGLEDEKPDSKLTVPVLSSLAYPPAPAVAGGGFGPAANGIPDGHLPRFPA